MILFKSDWKDYPSAIPDLQTTNTSWVNLAALFKSMGVQNYYFHLALMNPNLQGVDPHDPNLTLAQKAAIAVECKFNPWYYFREVIRIKDGGVVSPFMANRGVISMFWCFFCGIDYGMVMPRQTGKSVGSDCLKIGLLQEWLEDGEIFLFTKDSGLRTKNVKKVKDIIAELPPYLNKTTKHDADNTEIVTCKKLGNVMWTGIGQPSIENAIKMGRGFTIPITFTDEVAFIPNVHISLPALLASGTKIRNLMQENGKLFGNIFTTTAGKKDTEEGKFAYDLIMNGMLWNENIYDSGSKEEARLIVRNGSRDLGDNINGTFSHRQLGYTDEWLSNAIRKSRSDKDAADRDFLNIWTSGSLTSPLSVELNEVITNSIVEPFHTQLTNDKYTIRWYIPYEDIERRMKSSHFVIGLDSSQAVGRDANAIIIVDVRDMSVIAASDVKEANLHKYALWLGAFMVRYENTTLIIENKISGQSILDTVAGTLIKYGINPFKRMYNSVVDDASTRESDFKRISGKEALKEETYLSYKREFGFRTDSTRRYFLYDAVLQEAAMSTGHLVRDVVLSTEIRALVMKNGRVDHAQGKHDDTVIAWLMTHWFVKHSKNLYFYGIDPKICLSMVSDEGAIMTPEKLENKRKLMILNQEINEIKDRLIAAPNIIESKKYEKLLEWKIFEANKYGETTYSLDSIMDDVRKNKVTKKSLRESISDYQAKRVASMR